MEYGEINFDRILKGHIDEDSSSDLVFTPYHWKDMIECVVAVNKHGIVHSNLEPTPFLFIKDRLELIDFGIAATKKNTSQI